MWLPQENENAKGPPGHQQTATPRAQKTNSSINNHSFPKAVRILERKDFLKIMRTGMKIPGSSLIIFYRKKESGLTRLGITISKKHGKAHDRNRFKRLVREAFRLCRAQLPTAIEINVQPARKDKTLYSLPYLLDDFLRFSQKIRAQDPPP